MPSYWRVFKDKSHVSFFKSSRGGNKINIYMLYLCNYMLYKGLLLGNIARQFAVVKKSLVLSMTSHNKTLFINHKNLKKMKSSLEQNSTKWWLKNINQNIASKICCQKEMGVAHWLLNISYQKWCLYQVWQYVCVVRTHKIYCQQISFM